MGGLLGDWTVVCKGENMGRLCNMLCVLYKNKNKMCFFCVCVGGGGGFGGVHSQNFPFEH